MHIGSLANPINVSYLSGVGLKGLRNTMPFLKMVGRPLYCVKLNESVFNQLF